MKRWVGIQSAAIVAAVLFAAGTWVNLAQSATLGTAPLGDCCSPDTMKHIAGSVGFIDIAGIKLGMTPEQAFAAVKAFNPKLKIDIINARLEPGDAPGTFKRVPQFAVARAIHLLTSPDGLQLLADRALVTAPVTLDWGLNSAHSLIPVSPQYDQQGRQWVFRSWSDGGDRNRTYQVPNGSPAISILAQFVPAVPVALLTDPADCGPVTLAFCQDVQAEAYDWPEAFFRRRLWPTRRQPADPREIDDLARRLRAAKAPLVVAGGGVLYARAEAALAAFAARTGVPVAETQAGKGALAWDHPQALGSIGVTGTSASPTSTARTSAPRSSPTSRPATRASWTACWRACSPCRATAASTTRP